MQVVVEIGKRAALDDSKRSPSDGINMPCWFLECDRRSGGCGPVLRARRNMSD